MEFAMKKCYCNLCGKEMDFWDVQEEFSIQSYYIGYGSKHATAWMS